VNVSTPDANDVGYVVSGFVAGPTSTVPLVEYCEPWHGQTKRELLKPLIVQFSCVQIAVIAEKVSCDVCAMRNVPSEFTVIAPFPTVASGDPESTVMETVLPATLDVTVVNCGRFAGGVFDGVFDGAAGLLPPQPWSRTPAAASDAAWQA
jgi:hypothetical protein